MNAEIGVIQPQAKKCLPSPQAGRDTDFSLEPGAWKVYGPAHTLISDFQLPEL